LCLFAVSSAACGWSEAPRFLPSRASRLRCTRCAISPAVCSRGDVVMALELVLAWTFQMDFVSLPPRRGSVIGAGCIDPAPPKRASSAMDRAAGRAPVSRSTLRCPGPIGSILGPHGRAVHTNHTRSHIHDTSRTSCAGESTLGRERSFGVGAASVWWGCRCGAAATGITARSVSTLATWMGRRREIGRVSVAPRWPRSARSTVPMGSQ
jgi:hypothetical protein